MKWAYSIGWKFEWKKIRQSTLSPFSCFHLIINIKWTWFVSSKFKIGCIKWYASNKYMKHFPVLSENARKKIIFHQRKIPCQLKKPHRTQILRLQIFSLLIPLPHYHYPMREYYSIVNKPGNYIVETIPWHGWPVVMHSAHHTWEHGTEHCEIAHFVKCWSPCDSTEATAI